MNVTNLRPNNFSEFIGKDEIKYILLVAINNAKENSSNLDHIIFYGNPGIGKTSLATIISHELCRKIHYIQGGTIKQYSDLLDIVVMIEENDIVFIDEIHNIDLKCFDLFYSLLEDYVLDIKIGKEMNSQYTRFNVPKFTLIGSTTRLSDLPNPLVDRFPIKIFIDNYNEEEIFKILERINNSFENLVTIEELQKISNRSKGIPRIAINIYKRVMDFKLFQKEKFNINDCFRKIGIYPYGLEEIDIKYLKILNNYIGIPIGLNHLSQCLYIDKKMIENNIEPFLLKLNFIIRSKTGRQITNLGIQYIKDLNKFE